MLQDPSFGTWGAGAVAPRREPADPVTCARGFARSPTLARGAPEARPGRSRAEPLPGASGCPRAPRLGHWRAGKGAGAAAGRLGRALLFPRAQLRRRFRAAGFWAAARGAGGARRGAAARREPGDVCAAGGGGRRKERNNGGWGGLSCVRGRSDARAESWVARVALWRNVSAASAAAPSEGEGAG